MPEPDPIWLAPQSIGVLLDNHIIDATVPAAFSYGAAVLAAGQPRMGTGGTGLGSGCGCSALGIGSSGGSLTTQMPHSATRGLAAGTNRVVPVLGPFLGND